MYAKLLITSTILDELQFLSILVKKGKMKRKSRKERKKKKLPHLQNTNSTKEI